MKSSNGLVVIYTGEGKGKTTAALGLVLRAAGYGKKILIIQFGKNSFSGEVKSLKKFGSQIKLIQGGIGFVGILGDNKDLTLHKALAEKTFEILRKEMVSGKWDVIIADEIVGVIAGHLLDENLVLSLISDKPSKVDLILTGRFASDVLIDQADLVTEMKPLKHPYEKGIKARKGVDY